MRSALLTVLACTAGLVLVTPLGAQEDLAALLGERLQAIPKGRHAYQETWLLPASAEAAQSHEFAGRATIYQEGPRERIEIRKVEGGALAEPVVIVSNGRSYQLVTKVGATPFAESAPAEDSFVRLVLAGPPGEAPPNRKVVISSGGQALVLRSGLPTEFDSGEAFQLRLPQVGGGLLKSGLSQFSAAENTQVTASAGARGVDQIKTAEGTISVTPDPDAVRWMEGQAVSEVEYERFKMAAGLAPYDVLPQENPTAPGGAR